MGCAGYFDLSTAVRNDHGDLWIGLLVKELKMAPHTNRSSHVTQNHHSWAGWIGPILRIHKAMGSFLSSINKPTEDFAAEPSGHAMTGHGVDAMAPGGAGAGAGDDVLVLVEVAAARNERAQQLLEEED